ncbi:MAG: AIM24 family protein [Methanoregulaceae archaeon]|jgi:hypothetical protein
MGSLFFITIEIREGCEHLTKEPAQRLHSGLSSIHIHYKPVSVSGLKETLLSGEGLVTEITGPGEVYIQPRTSGRWPSGSGRSSSRGYRQRRGNSRVLFCSFAVSTRIFASILSLIDEVVW